VGVWGCIRSLFYFTVGIAQMSNERSISKRTSLAPQRKKMGLVTQPGRKIQQIQETESVVLLTPIQGFCRFGFLVMKLWH
jgi:hypothetical protein